MNNEARCGMGIDLNSRRPTEQGVIESPSPRPVCSTPLRATRPFLLAIAVFWGCDRSVPDSQPQQPSLSEEELKAQHQIATQSRFDRALKLIEKQIAETPGDFDGIIGNLRELHLNFQGYSFAEQAGAMLAAQRQRRDQVARDGLGEVSEEVDRLVTDGDFPGAEEALEAFRRRVVTTGMRDFDQTSAFGEWEEKKKSVNLFFRAESEANLSKQRAEEFASLHQYARAVATLEAYPRAFAESPYAADIRRLVDEYYAKYQESRAEQEKLQQIPWQDLEIDRFLGNWSAYSPGDAEVWRVAGETIEGKNTTSSDAFLIAQIGDEWQDFMLRFEVKVPDQVMQLGLRRHHIQKSNFQLHAVDLGSDGWQGILVEILNDNAKISERTTSQTLLEKRIDLEYPKGGFAFLLRPGKELYVRKVQYRRIREATESEEKNG